MVSMMLQLLLLLLVTWKCCLTIGIDSAREASALEKSLSGLRAVDPMNVIIVAGKLQNDAVKEARALINSMLLLTTRPLHIH